MTKTYRNKGIVTLIFLLIMALIATLILIIGQSRLLLSLQRGKSAGDTIITSYQAEYEINDLLARLKKGSLKPADFAQFPITKTIAPNFTLKIDGRIEGNNQILTVTSQRLFATSKIQAIRAVQEASTINQVDLVLSLDCTGSMSSSAGPGATTTRMEEQKKAALSFIDAINDHPNGDFINLGVAVFGIDVKWLTTTDGRQIRPNSNINIADTRAAVEARFSRLWDDSSACKNNIMNATSIGSGFSIAVDYFKQNPTPNVKPVQVLITDGEPNSRMPYADCSPDVFCPGANQGTYCANNPYGWTCAGQGNSCLNPAKNFMECTLAKQENGGVRPNNVDTYSVTVLSNPPGDVVNILEDNSTAYYNTSNASQLTAILDTIFESIVSSLSTTTISRVIPLEE